MPGTVHPPDAVSRVVRQHQQDRLTHALDQLLQLIPAQAHRNAPAYLLSPILFPVEDPDDT
ncbi:MULTISPECIES: hypothetical protein [unclassified Kribbella]|uniref:hypothetical protein n=1 Tax=unclassified Kribbella TaxID=2644121 RepID=UPI0033E4ECBB